MLRKIPLRRETHFSTQPKNSLSIKVTLVFGKRNLRLYIDGNNPGTEKLEAHTYF